jgi:hypothetical protein
MARPIRKRKQWFLNHSPGGAGRCLEHTHDAIDLPPAGIPTANQAVAYLRENDKLYGGQPPVGAMVLWTSSTYGHAALSLGRNRLRNRWMIASTDVKGPNTVGVVPLGYIAQYWGHQYAGWSDWYAGETYEVGYNMPLSNEDIKKIAAEVWNHELENTTTPDKKKFKAEWFLNSILGKTKK